MQKDGFKIARLFGIDIIVHSSWLIIFFLVAWSFTVSLIPLQFPDFNLAVGIILGVTMTILFFVSVLTHEMAHSLYAKSQKLDVKSITLFVFGGASEITTEPSRPGQEFAMAGIGPLTSLGLSLVFGLVGYVGLVTGLEVLQAVGVTLSGINFLLAVFNLLPGLPLDGGRLFRALVWKISNNFLRATKVASTAGKLIGYILIIYGILQFVTLSSLGGVWLVLIGMFLISAAKASYVQTLITHKFKDLSVSDVMEPARFEINHSVQLEPDDSIAKAIDIMQSQQKTVLYVGKNKRPKGIITRDALARLFKSA